MKRLLAATVLAAMLVFPASVSARALRLDAPELMAPAGTSQGELTKAAVDLFVLSDPPCKVVDFRFIVNSRMVVAACDDKTVDDFAGMFRIDGRWQPGVYDTGR